MMRGKCIKQTGAYALFIVRPKAPSQGRVNLQAQVTSLQAQSKPELSKLQHEYVTTIWVCSSKSPRCSRSRCVPICCVPISTDIPRLYVLTSLAYALFDVPSFPAAVPPKCSSVIAHYFSYVSLSCVQALVSVQTSLCYGIVWWTSNTCRGISKCFYFVCPSYFA